MKKKCLLFFVTTVAVILLDQITKAYISSTMSIHESFAVIEGFFNITYIRNPGAAFGFLTGVSPVFRYVFFLSATIAVILLILHYIRKSKEEELLLIFSLSLILAGAMGNLIDRVRFGEVIDFLDVYIGFYHWPAFNAADSAISTGAAILILITLKRKKG
ncbi:MAG: signal peptidase II [Syntrophales bacterium]|nr:signal peptidase II [Syntrophales bacterium]